MFYDNILRLYQNKISFKKIIENNVFIVKKMWEVDKKFFLFFAFRTLFFLLKRLYSPLY